MVFLELALRRVPGTVLTGGRQEASPDLGRVEAAALDMCTCPLDTDLNLDGAGFCEPRPGTSPPDSDRLLVKFPVFWPTALGAAGLGSALLTLALDFHRDPILDWTIFPLYMPGADFDDETDDTDMVSACLSAALKETAFPPVSFSLPFSWRGAAGFVNLETSLLTKDLPGPACPG